jgi:hypothetical protein
LRSVDNLLQVLRSKLTSQQATNRDIVAVSEDPRTIDQLRLSKHPFARIIDDALRSIDCNLSELRGTSITRV